jgi:hypothetical protein
MLHFHKTNKFICIGGSTYNSMYYMIGRRINNFVYLSFDIYKIIMTSCQTFYCTNEKGKCEKNSFFVITDQDFPS